MSKRVLRIALLLVLLGGVVPLKAQLRYGLGERANDADYYYTIARSVAEGEGLKSNLSLYYQGFKTLPHLVTGSPVWPLLLGAVGAVVGLDIAAVWVPNTLHLLALALLYGLALRLRRGIEVGGGGGWFREQSVVTLGHVAVLLFATNVVFFQFSSVPNNEPLAFCLVFGALLALDRAARECHVGWAVAAGALAGLAVLTRIQALAVAIAVPVVLVGVALSDARARPKLDSFSRPAHRHARQFAADVLHQRRRSSVCNWPLSAALTRDPPGGVIQCKSCRRGQTCSRSPRL